MPVSPVLLNDLLLAVQSENSLQSYQAASQLERLKPEMDEAQRAVYEAGLAAANHQRQAARKAQEETEQAKLDEWDKKDDW